LTIILYLKLWSVLLLAFVIVLCENLLSISIKNIYIKCIWSKFEVNIFDYYLVSKIVIGSSGWKSVCISIKNKIKINIYDLNLGLLSYI